MRLTFSQLVTVPVIQRLLEFFFKTTKIGAAVFESDGTILASAGWRDICANFHRKHPQTRLRCVQSDTIVASNQLRRKKYAIYNCKNGLVDTVVPVIIEKKHFANVFFGQFLLEKPDLSWFREQAQKYGFDESAYLDAVLSIPVLQQEDAELGVEYLFRLAELLQELGLLQLQQIAAEKAIRENEDKLIEIARVLDRTSTKVLSPEKIDPQELNRPFGSMVFKDKSATNSGTSMPVQKDGTFSITSRQQQVLELIVRGYSTKEIATKLAISLHTAESHRMNLMERLGVHDVASLVRCAIKTGVIDLRD